MTLLNVVLLWAHVVGAIGWLGAAMVFGMVVGPSLPNLSPPSRGEFVTKVLPKYIRYTEALMLTTIVFGILTALVFAEGDYAIYSFSNPFGTFIVVGATIALVTLLLSTFYIIPSAKKVCDITRSMEQNPGPPPPELMKYSKRLRVGSTTGMVLLIVVTVFMVAAATL